MRNCAASAPQATRNADSSMLGKVHTAASAVPPACIAGTSSFKSRMGWANMTKEREHGTRPHEVREPAQLPRIAHRADRGAYSIPDARPRNARAARGGPQARGTPADAGARGSFAQMADARIRHGRRGRDRRRAVQRKAREHDLRARYRDLLDVRAPHAPVFRQGARRLSAER